MRILGLALCLCMLCASCFVIDNRYSAVAPGLWRAELALVQQAKKATPYNPNDPDAQIERLTDDLQDGVLPFHFEVSYPNNDEKMQMHIINGPERIPVKDISFGTDKETGRDTIVINFPVYESYIKGEVEEKLINGDWVVTTRKNYAIPFSAKFGQANRFTDAIIPPAADLSGKWSATFGLNEEEPWPAIGEFVQKGNNLNGTFLTETGDYRYLEGTVQGNKFYLSTFDGAHAFLFSGKILEDNTIVGSFRSGTHYRTTWSAKKSDEVQLKSADSLTYLLPDAGPFDFAFPNTDGVTTSLNDDQYNGKAKIVQIFGTWCPNCRDEADFLVDYFSNNPNDKLAVIALAFEKHRESEKAIAAIKRYKEHLNIPYEMLHAGYYNKKEAREALPMLNEIISYPTMIFLNNKNEIVKIHTGFSGPATSKFEEFKTNFEETVKEITNY